MRETPVDANCNSVGITN